MASRESRLPPGLGLQGRCGRSVPLLPVGPWEPFRPHPPRPRVAEAETENQPSLASTSFSSISWLSGSIQKAHQGPLPVQKLLEGTHLCNGPIFQHHNAIGLGQDVE